MTLKKINLVERTYDQLELGKHESVAAVDSLFEIIKDELTRGKTVMISGFGKWSVKAKKERNGRNPQTGETIAIDARRVVTFKPSHVLRDALN